MRTLALVILVLAGAFVWFWHKAEQSQELRQKLDISRLQGIEIAYRGKDLDRSIILVKEDGTCSVGILATDKRARAWILLYSPTTKIVYQSVPKPYAVTQNQVDQIEKECRISSGAKNELLAHMNRAAL